MAGVAATNVPIVDFNTITALTASPATEDGAGTAQVFTFTPTVSDSKYLIILHNPAAQGTITYSIAAGGFWAAGGALTGSVVQSSMSAILLSARYKAATGTIAITVTPYSTNQLTTTHTFKVYAVELPF